MTDHHRGDDLDDDFVPDDLVALSADEAPESDNPPSDADTPNEDSTSNSAAAALEKKRKRKAKADVRKAKKRKFVESIEEIEASVADNPSAALADYLALKQAKTFSKSSAVELEDIRIPESAIVNTTQWSGSRTLDNLAPFINKVLPTLHTRLNQKSKSNGAPTLLFIVSNALRVVDATRILKDKKLRGDKSGEVAKLFARHFKLQEHVDYLRRTKVGSAVGTPGRIGKLLEENDGLSLTALSHIILDTTFRDAKKRSLLDIPETRDEVFKTVFGNPKVMQGIRQGKIQVVLF